LIDIFGRLVVAVDFLVLAVVELARHETGMTGDRRERIGSTRGGGRYLVADNDRVVGVERGVQHGHLLCGGWLLVRVNRASGNFVRYLK
jgi:hypothetical protein